MALRRAGIAAEALCSGLRAGRKLVFLSLVVSGLLWPTRVHAETLVATDFDKDGLSNLTLVSSAAGAQTLRWFYLGDAYAENELTTFGRREDLPALGRWLEKDAPQPGVASLDKAHDEVNWKVRSASGAQHLLTFGSAADLLLAGADFDGSGYADLAAAKVVGGAVTWRLLLDPFADPGRADALRQFAFGKNGDRVFFAPLENQEDWLGLVRPGRGTRSVVRLRRISDGAVRTFSRFPAFVSEEPRPRPVGLRAEDGTLRLMFPVSGASATRLFFASMNGARLGSVNVRGAKEMAVGNFDAAPGEELAILARGKLLILSSAGKQLSVSAAPDGSLVDEIQIATFSTQSGSGGLVTSCVLGKTNDGPSGFLWKPISDTQHFAVVVLPEALTGNIKQVKIKTVGGEALAALRYKGVGNGGRTAWQDLAKTGAEYKARYGRIQVEATKDDGSCLAYLISDPAIRID